jgi:hypothetical protein
MSKNIHQFKKSVMWNIALYMMIIMVIITITIYTY